MNKYLLCIALALLAENIHAEDYYRSLDGNGKIVYGDKPLDDAADISKFKPQAEPIPEENLSFETRRAKERFPVTLYVAENCGKGCALARDYLNKRGIPFTEKNLSTFEEIEAFKKASGGDVIPTMNISTRWLKKFSLPLWAKELDDATYPKVAPYGSRPSANPAPALNAPGKE